MELNFPLHKKLNLSFLNLHNVLYSAVSHLERRHPGANKIKKQKISFF